MTVSAAADVARRVKAAAPSTLVVVGGPHATALPEATLEAFPWLDAAAIGEAEQTLVELLSAELRGEGSIERVAGLLWRSPNGELIRTAERELLDDLDQLPFPAWDLLPALAVHYRPPLNGVSRLPAGSLITSRGCTGRCTFCDRAVSGHRMRFHSAGYVLEMVEELRGHYGLRDLHFHDDNFLAKPSRLLELCGLLETLDLDVTWSAEGRVDLVRPDLLDAMKRAGCWQVAYGIESGSQEILDRLCKGATIEQARRAVVLTREAGIQARGLFMVGVPNETAESIKATCEMLLSLPLNDMVVQTFSPHPGTEIARDLGMPLSSPAEWASSSRFEISYVPEGLTATDLAAAQKKMFRDFYVRPRVVFAYARRMFGSAALAGALLRGLLAWVSFVFSSSRSNSE